MSGATVSSVMFSPLGTGDTLPKSPNDTTVSPVRTGHLRRAHLRGCVAHGGWRKTLTNGARFAMSLFSAGPQAPADGVPGTFISWRNHDFPESESGVFVGRDCRGRGGD